jgi:hypothetical protein
MFLRSTYNTDYAHHPNYAHFSYNWVTWRLGAMLLEFPMQEWMLQWYVLRRCAQVHPTQWRLQPQRLHGWTHSATTHPSNHAHSATNLQAHDTKANNI